MQTITQNNFITVKTEGGILPAALLRRIAHKEVEELNATNDYLTASERPFSNHQLRLEPAREGAAIWSRRLMQSRGLLLRPVFCQAREW